MARERRNALAEADELFWRSLSAGQETTEPVVEEARRRHQQAQKLAIARGFVFRPVDDLAQSDNVVELVQRIETVERAPNMAAEAEALLGGAQAPRVTITETLELYLTTLSVGEQKGKSPDQLRKWRLPRQRAIKHFVTLCGDLRMDEIERHHAVGSTSGGQSAWRRMMVHLP